MQKKILRLPWLFTAMTIVTIGCDSQDERVAQLAIQSAERQAGQNAQMAQLQQEVAAGTRSLVEANAQSRQELLAMHRDLQGERLDVGRERDHLEAERQALAEERQTAPLIAEALTNLGLILACLLPLVVCWSLLHYGRDDSAQGLSELLIQELVSNEPLLPQPATTPPAIGHEALT